jgi:hypothetical protein
MQGRGFIIILKIMGSEAVEVTQKLGGWSCHLFLCPCKKVSFKLHPVQEALRPVD